MLPAMGGTTDVSGPRGRGTHQSCPLFTVSGPILRAPKGVEQNCGSPSRSRPGRRPLTAIVGATLQLATDSKAVTLPSHYAVRYTASLREHTCQADVAVQADRAQHSGRHKKAVATKFIDSHHKLCSRLSSAERRHLMCKHAVSVGCCRS